MITAEMIKNFVKNYYTLLDNYAAIEKLQDFFYEDFKIIEEPMIIDNLEEYALWYESVNNLFSKREHTFEIIQIDAIEDGFYVLMNMNFLGIKNTEETKVNARIKWHIKTQNENLSIKRYEILKV